MLAFRFLPLLTMRTKEIANLKWPEASLWEARQHLVDLHAQKNSVGSQSGGTPNGEEPLSLLGDTSPHQGGTTC